MYDENLKIANLGGGGEESSLKMLNYDVTE